MTRHYATILSLVLLASAASAGSVAGAQPVLIDRIEASVNSALVLASDIQHFRANEKLRAQLDPLYTGTVVGQKGDAASDAEITQYIIDEKLILQQFPVSDAEVEQEINSIQANNKIDRQSLKTALAQQGFKFEDYFELIRASVAKRNLIDRDIRTKVSITDNDIKNYYYNKLAQNGAQAGRAYQLHVIYLSPKTYKTTLALKEAAQQARDAIRKGESFEDVAKRVSDDPNASSGGDLGVLTDDQMSPAIRDQVKKLQIGQVSDIFGSTSQGYYLVKLIDVRSDESGRIDKMKEEIRNQLVASEFQHQIQLWLERQRESSFIHKVGESIVKSIPASARPAKPSEE